MYRIVSHHNNVQGEKPIYEIAIKGNGVRVMRTFLNFVGFKNHRPKHQVTGMLVSMSDRT